MNPPPIRPDGPSDRASLPGSATLLRAISGDARLVAGIAVSSRTGKLTAALVGAHGANASCPLEVMAHATAQLPSDVIRQLEQLPGEGQPASAPGPLAEVRRELARVQSDLLRALVATARTAENRILAVAVLDSGAWRVAAEHDSGFDGLCDSTLLAQLSGMNVIDALPARDVAAGGHGGPITALAEARLLQTRHRSTLLVDFGRTLRATYIPAESLTRGRADKRPRVLSFQVGPGMWLVDALAQKLTGGGQTHDAGGRLAVQGQLIAELLLHWQRDLYFDQPLPRWDAGGVNPERFLSDAYQLAVTSNWSVRDLLCTATHFLAQLVADTVQRRLPAGYPVDEIVVSGGGIQNGLLMRHLAARLPTMPLVRLAERGCPAEALEAAATAIVGLLTIEQQPASLPEISGVREACVAGRFTPGTPAAWRQLVAEMSATQPAGLALRAAS